MQAPILPDGWQETKTGGYLYRNPAYSFLVKQYNETWSLQTTFAGGSRTPPQHGYATAGAAIAAAEAIRRTMGEAAPRGPAAGGQRPEPTARGTEQQHDHPRAEPAAARRLSAMGYSQLEALAAQLVTADGRALRVPGQTQLTARVAGGSGRLASDNLNGGMLIIQYSGGLSGQIQPVVAETQFGLSVNRKPAQPDYWDADNGPWINVTLREEDIASAAKRRRMSVQGCLSSYLSVTTHEWEMTPEFRFQLHRGAALREGRNPGLPCVECGERPGRDGPKCRECWPECPRCGETRYNDSLYAQCYGCGPGRYGR